jgi:acetate kinase
VAGSSSAPGPPANGLAFLAVQLRAAANEGGNAPPDAEISATGSPLRTFVIEAREDREMAREVRAVLRQ